MSGGFQVAFLVGLAGIGGIRTLFAAEVRYVAQTCLGPSFIIGPEPAHVSIMPMQTF
jgi:hypothetical protein